MENGGCAQGSSSALPRMGLFEAAGLQQLTTVCLVSVDYADGRSSRTWIRATQMDWETAKVSKGLFPLTLPLPILLFTLFFPPCLSGLSLDPVLQLQKHTEHKDLL
ncbi:hypothetical protein PDJAM_G00242160 [Pangasius djambal]|uniref:Uncharacterized protein n=1 Tax=Pangasius djambal TaxID=1691987 RepID=A0ACC5YH64_9TELE|nr:hypothetical protein [Pangasius djambal]